MLRAIANRLAQATISTSRTNVVSSIGFTSVRHHSKSTETDAEFDARYEAFFNKPDIDGWEIRKAFNDLQGYDMVPEPKIIVAALKACRRVNDYALAVRYLESVKDKCGNRVSTIWPYIKQEITPTLQELGVDTPEDLGYDKPELAVMNVNDMHG